MSTKEYPLDHIQALHLLTGEDPVTLEDEDGDRYHREKNAVRMTYFNNGSVVTMGSWYVHPNCSTKFRIYEPPKLEPVELCEELVKHIGGHNGFAYKLYGLLIAQALRMAREEREAEKKGDGK
jgi:hypothetical protein